MIVVGNFNNEIVQVLGSIYFLVGGKERSEHFDTRTRQYYLIQEYFFTIVNSRIIPEGEMILYDFDSK